MNRRIRLSQNSTPGTPVFVWVFGVVKHHGIVSDRWQDGRPMVISNSLRQGTTAEETWREFSQGGEVFVAHDLRSRLAPGVILLRAREWIGRRYRPLALNCDHHVRHALGLPVKSPQVRTALGIAAGAIVAAVILRGRTRLLQS